MDTKRSLPKSLPAAACAASAVALAGFLPGSTATAQPATPIQHVVVIYLENHSFDNVLGYWCNANPGRCPDGGMPSSVTLSNGAVVTPTTDPDTLPVVSHSVASQLAAMNITGGKPLMNGWQNIQQGQCAAATNYRCISGYQPAQIPNLTKLAQDFAISDKTFSMADSPSWGGHLYAVMPSMDGFTGDNPTPATGVTPGPGWGCDSNLVAPWRGPLGGIHYEPSCIPDFSLRLPNGGAFRPTSASYHATILDELNQAGLAWKIYGQSAPVFGGGLPGFGNAGWIWSICPSLAECLDTGPRANLVDNGQFFTDAAAGTLPAYSVVTAGGATDGGVLGSCHNSFSMTACDNYIGQLVTAAESGPEWPSTAIFITFDDCGCFYDQVPPGLNPDFTQQGPRVPLIIVSPYAKPGFTDTTPATFAGILAYTEHTFGLGALGPNDNYAYPFSNAFNYSQVPLKPARMVQRPLPASAKHIHLTGQLLNDPS
jgi:phospholipase C